MNPTAVDHKREQPDRTAQNVQDGFLNTARKERIPVIVYLTTGVKLSGRIRSFDKFSLILENNHQEQLIFKHAISTVVLYRPSSAQVAPAAEEV